MGESLCLKVPEKRRKAETIDEYYDFLRQKCQNFDDPSDVLERVENERERVLSQFEESGYFSISGSIPSDSGAIDAYDEVVATLVFENPSGNRIDDPEKIEQVRECLIGIKNGLQSMGGGPPRSDGVSYTPDQREVQFQIGPIAICEFALEHGFGVSLDY